jgi:hypothetical protein
MANPKTCAQGAHVAWLREQRLAVASLREQHDFRPLVALLSARPEYYPASCSACFLYARMCGREGSRVPTLAPRNRREVDHAGHVGAKGGSMGQPVVHFEVIGKDGEKLQRYYAELFGWEIDSNNPLSYGPSPGKGTPTPTASESAAAWHPGQLRTIPGTSPSTSKSRCRGRARHGRALGGDARVRPRQRPRDRGRARSVHRSGGSYDRPHEGLGLEPRRLGGAGAPGTSPRRHAHRPERARSRHPGWPRRVRDRCSSSGFAACCSRPSPACAPRPRLQGGAGGRVSCSPLRRTSPTTRSCRAGQRPLRRGRPRR